MVDGGAADASGDEPAGEIDPGDVDARVPGLDAGDAPRPDAGAPPDAAPVCHPVTELCNRVDDDCDGEIDEDASEAPIGEACGSGGQGVCATTGKQICFDGIIKCNAPPSVPQTEVCDGVDNDCDGVVDNVAGKGAACSVGAGECVAAGVMDCVSAGALACNAKPKSPVAEACDNKDNDCNGTVDDNVPMTSCSAGIGECKRAGVLICASGAARCSAVAALAVAEVCDGKDNDCDGQVDNLNQACGNGQLGVCYRAGQLRCTNGAPTCDAPAGSPTTCTLADGLDNDCDGLVDEDSSQDDPFNGGFLQKC